MFRGSYGRVFSALAGFLLVLTLSLPVPAQGLRNVIQPAGRAFPSVGAGVSTIERDSTGRYYILAKPATHILVFDPDGRQVAQIPPAGATSSIVYAMDFDLAADGSVYVADRGANAVLIFRPDGSLASRVSVFAPTSVVALPGHQFAVASFHARRLVQVFDDRGMSVRSFGDPADSEPPPSPDDDPSHPKKEPVYLGRIFGDPSGQIYFAFAATPDPTFRRYDRYGYVAYEASVPEDELVSPDTDRFDRVEFSFNFNRFDLSDQFAGSATFGSSGDLRFGGGIGAGAGAHLGRAQEGGGGGYGETSGRSTGFGGQFGGPMGGGSGMLAAQAEVAPNSFHVMIGGTPSAGGTGRAIGGSSNSGSGPDLQGNVLQFAGTGTASGKRSSDDPDFAQLESTDLLNPLSGTSSGVDYTSALAPDYSSDASPSIPGGLGIGNYGGPGGSFNEHFLYNRFFGGGFDFAGHPPGAAGTAHPAGGTGAGGAPGETGHAGSPGEPYSHYGPHGHFGGGMTGYVGGMRINLDKPVHDPNDKPVLSSMSVDPETQNVWAAIGDVLVCFDKSGNVLGVFTLVTSGNVPLKPSAILVEHDRVLVAADPWGVFQFARPDAYLSPQLRAASPAAQPASPQR